MLVGDDENKGEDDDSNNKKKLKEKGENKEKMGAFEFSKN